MPSRNRSGNASTVRKGSGKKNMKDKMQVRRGATPNMSNVKAKVTSGKKSNVKPMTLQAEFSTILKEPGEELTDDIGEESFNPPLHSTAVFDDDASDKAKSPKVGLAKISSPGPSVGLQKRANNSASKVSSVSNKSKVTAANVSLAKKQQTDQQLKPVEESFESSNSTDIAKDKPTASSQPPSDTVSDKSKYPETPKSGINKNTPILKKSKKADAKEKVQLIIWSPEDVPRTARDLNELDVVLYEFEELVESYRETADTDASRNAVDDFFRSFKDQLTNSMKDVQMVVNVKRKNAQLQNEIRKKQKRLMDVREEVIKQQPQMNQLQKKCSELEKSHECLNNAENFLNNLQQLQENYRTYKAKNPKIKETYGLSSLSACLLETQSTLKAEQHFHTVNTKLQSFLDKMT